MRWHPSRLFTILAITAWGLGPGAFAQSIQPPRLAEPLKLQYPAQARRHEIEGVTIVAVETSASGNVTRAQVYSSSGHNLLDAEALRAVAQARFHPARRNGAAVAIRSRLPVGFRLEGPPKPLIATEAIALVQAPVEPSTVIRASITREGMVYLGSRPMGLADMPGQLKAQAQEGRSSLKIYADEDAPYGHVVRLITAAQEAGVAQVLFVVAAP